MPKDKYDRQMDKIERQKQAKEYQETLKKIKCVTKKRLVHLFDQDAIDQDALKGPQWMVQSCVERFGLGPIHGVIPTEISKNENIGPGQYRHPDPFVPNIHLSTKKRFLIDAMTADVRTEIQLPGTENIGPGYYRMHHQPDGYAYGPVKNPAPVMSSTVNRFADILTGHGGDPRSVTTEMQRNAETGPGYFYVPQYHLFRAEDGSLKEAQAPTVPKDKRFQVSPTMREKNAWAAQQGPLDDQEEWWRRETWDRHAQPLATGPRMMGHSPLDVSHNLPLDAHQQGVPLVGHTQSPEMRSTLNNKAQKWQRKSATSITTKKRPSTTVTANKPALSHFSAKVRHHATMTQHPRAEPSFHPGTPARVKAQLMMQHRPPVRSRPTARSQTASHPGTMRTAPTVGTPQAGLQSGGVPRCAEHIYSRRVDRSPVPLSDGFMTDTTRHTIQQATLKDERTDNIPFGDWVAKVPETAMLWMHQPSILTNTESLGPGTYFGCDKFGVGDPRQINNERDKQKTQLDEFRNGCPAHQQELDIRAQKLLDMTITKPILAFE